MFQLADEKVQFLSTRKDIVFTGEEIQTRLGFEPGCIVDFIALAGDKTDNIPGVSGIGEVTARKLIKQYGTLVSH